MNALPSHEEMAALAASDPAGFEQWRAEVVADFIDHVPEKYQRRLNGLQFQIDAIRRTTGNPLGAAVKIQQLMWNSFLRLNDELNEGFDFQNESPKAQTSAAVLPFRKKPAA